MGQATADLPDSIEKPSEPIGNADELLSQFAGEEIDRLLKEADAHPDDAREEDSPAAATSEATGPMDITPPQPDESPAAQIAHITGEELDQEIAASAPASPAADPFEAQVNELFNELKDLPEPTPPAPAAADIPPHSSPSQVINASALATALEQSTSSAERAALEAPLLPSQPPQEPVDAPPSVLVRILEIINAPVRSLPNSLRDNLGKVAILTLMNSVGVLLYLVLFRK